VGSNALTTAESMFMVIQVDATRCANGSGFKNLSNTCEGIR